MIPTYRVMAVTIVVFILMLPFSSLAGSETNGSTPIRIHLSWEGDPRSEITVMWETERAADSVVEYGPDGNLGSSAQGESSRPSWANGYIHQVRLSDLEPDTGYHYRCGSSDGWSGTFTFLTAPDRPEDFSFIVLGDSRNPGYYNSDLSGWEMVMQAMQDDMRENDDGYKFIHFLGDNIYDPNQQYVWEKWFDKLSIVSRDIVFMESIGNHEYDYDTSEPVPNYFGQFAFPGNELWYSYDYGNAHIISLDTDNDFLPGSPQYEWLVDDLEEVSQDDSLKWNIVMFHRPPFTSGGKGNLDVQEHLCPLFDQYDVDLVLSGHMHIYERFYPLNQYGEIADTNQAHYEDPSVPIYIVDGCAGAPQYSATPRDWTAYMENEYGYSRISINLNGTLHFEHVQVKSGQRTVVDGFYIEKESAEHETIEDEAGSSAWVFGIIAIVVALAILTFVLLLIARGARKE